MTTGERIKALRVSLGMSQSELARLSHSSKQNIYKYEKDIITNIPLNKLELISQILNTTPSHLVGWKGEEKTDGNFTIGMNTGEYIKYLRTKSGYSQEQLVKLVGVKRAAVQKWESGKVQNLKQETIKKLAEIFSVSPSSFIESDNSELQTIKIPVLGRVAAGIPFAAIEDIIDYEEIPSSWLNGNNEYFGLQIKGDSMSPRILEGDVVIVRKQTYADTGDLVIALVNGYEATCKKYIRNENGITLVSFNTAYNPMYFSEQDIIDKPVQILGKVVELRGKFE